MVAGTAVYEQAAVVPTGVSATVITPKGDLDSALLSTAKAICSLIGVERCLICLLEPGTRRFRGRVSTHAGTVTANYVAEARPGTFTEELVVTRAPVVITDTGTDPRAGDSLLRQLGARSVLGVPMVNDDVVVGLLVVDSVDIPYIFDVHQQETAMALAGIAAFSVTSTSSATVLRDDLAAVRRDNARLRQTNLLEERFAELAAAAASAADVAQLVAEVTKKPCSILDARDGQIAVGRNMLDPNRIPAHLDARIRSHPRVSVQLATAEDADVNIIDPVPDLGIHYRHMLVALYARGLFWGHLVLMETGNRFAALDILAVRRGAVLAAAAIAQHQTALGDRQAANRRGPHRHRGREVFRRQNGPAAKESYPGDLPSAPTQGPYVVAVITDAAGDLSDGLVPIERACSAMGFRVISRPHRHGDSCAVVAIDLDKTLPRPAAVAHARRQIRTMLDTATSDRGLIASLSKVCEQPVEFHEGIKDAYQTLCCLTAFAPARRRPQVLSTDDLGAARLFLSAADPTEARQFAHEHLGPLLHQGNDELLVTLTAFFDSSHSVRLTAAALAVHENTVRYRLARITEITGLDLLVNTTDQLSAHVALLVLKLEMGLEENTFE
jgi:PucR C-terminal helix-turn-helix domain/GAF domain